MIQNTQQLCEEFELKALSASLKIDCPAGLLEELGNRLSYDPHSGKFYWRDPRSRKIKTGNEAGYIDDNGYVIIRIFGRQWRAHQLAVAYMLGYFVVEIDHEDGVRHNNKFGNLRPVRRTNNCVNRTISESNNTEDIDDYKHCPTK